MDTPMYGNSVIIGTNTPGSIDNFTANTGLSNNPLVDTIGNTALDRGNLRTENNSHFFFTDDQAPVEQLIDSIILDAITGKGG
jgi:hypothetical protein